MIQHFWWWAFAVRGHLRHHFLRCDVEIWNESKGRESRRRENCAGNCDVSVLSPQVSTLGKGLASHGLWWASSFWSTGDCKRSWLRLYHYRHPNKPWKCYRRRKELCACTILLATWQAEHDLFGTCFEANCLRPTCRHYYYLLDKAICYLIEFIMDEYCSRNMLSPPKTPPHRHKSLWYAQSRPYWRANPSREIT